MCGIIAYLGNNNAQQILVKCLEYLEYRGYDSTGICTVFNNELNVYKSVGKISNLKNQLKGILVPGTIGIGHSRWATHGTISILNAHPHISKGANFGLVHNGIVENFKVLKDYLLKRGYTFDSETDTETIVNLVDDIKESEGVSLQAAIQDALKQIVGAYAMVFIDKSSDDMLIAANKSSSLIIGFNDDYSEYVIASDIKCISMYVKNVIYLKDSQMAVVTKNKPPVILGIDGIACSHVYIETLKKEIDVGDKAGYKYYLLKEIHEQPTSIFNSMRGRIDAGDYKVNLGGIYNSQKTLQHMKRVTFVGCGTSFHACMIGEYIFESILGIPAKAINAAEYRNRIVQEDEVVVAISQSGETADTLSALKFAKDAGAYTLGICNVTSSSIARTTHCGCYIHAGPEISVASTKAFTSQVVVLLLISMYISQIRRYECKKELFELVHVCEKIKWIINTQEEKIKALAHKLCKARSMLFLGRGILHPVALESALKMKELTYIHAEGILTSELKHGPLAMIDKKLPIIVFAPQCSTFSKTINNIEEIKSRHGNVIAITTVGTSISGVKHCIEIPETSCEFLLPLLTIVPIQLLAYHIALLKNIDIDTPRNIAKSVTVE